MILVLGVVFSSRTVERQTRLLLVPQSNGKNYDPLPVSPPKTSLLKFDWSEYGRIDPFECPGPFWETGRT